MLLLKTHSHTSERLGYEAEKERQVKRERKGAYPKRRENVNGNHRHVTWKGGARRKRVDGRAKTQSSATTAARGGEAKLYHRAKGLACSWKTKKSQASNKFAICTEIQVEQAKTLSPSSVRRHV